MAAIFQPLLCTIRLKKSLALLLSTILVATLSASISPFLATLLAIDVVMFGGYLGNYFFFP